MGVIARRHPTYLQSREQTRRHRPDYFLLVLTVALIVIGVIVVYSISPALAVEKGTTGSQQVLRQLIAVGLGLGVFIAAAWVPLPYWRALNKPLLAAAAGATLLALILPVNEQYPAHRWIRIEGFSFQSVELLKFAGIMWLSGFLAQRMQAGILGDMNKTLKPLFGVLIGTAAVVAGLQSDLGSFGVIVAVMAVMMFVAGMPMKRIVLGAVIIALLGAVLVTIAPYRRDRLTAFMRPDCTGNGYQACQALIAVGSGGMVGQGLGRGVQAYGYLPEAENDSIFAIYAEKFGFIGTVLLLGLYAALFTRIRKIAERAPDDFTKLAVTGILVWLSAQTIVNVGAMLGLLPLKGITLPLVSYGGSSVLMVMGALGVVFQVSRHTLLGSVGTSENVTGGTGYEDGSDRRRFRGAYHSSAGRRA